MKLTTKQFTQRLLSPPLKGRCGWRQAAAKCAPWSVWRRQQSELTMVLVVDSAQRHIANYHLIWYQSLIWLNKHTQIMNVQWNYEGVFIWRDWQITKDVLKTLKYLEADSHPLKEMRAYQLDDDAFNLYIGKIYLSGGFNPFEKCESNWIIFRSRGESLQAWYLFCSSRRQAQATPFGGGFPTTVKCCQKGRFFSSNPMELGLYIPRRMGLEYLPTRNWSFIYIAFLEAFIWAMKKEAGCLGYFSEIVI